jgi:hypothetical protein
MPSTSEQLATFKEFLKGRLLNREHPLFNYAISWVRNYPGGLTERDKVELRGIICHTFNLTLEELLTTVASNGNVIEVEKGESGPNARDIEQSLRAIIPPGGFYDRYCTFTERSEAPLAYHLFCALVVIGATLNRRVWFDMGIYRLFPNLSAIILGPSGIKKTSAANIALGLVHQLDLVKVYSEKLTPEQLVEAMKEHAQGLIYAPEMAAFLGRQRYMEGIVPLITRLMDCPDVWSSETIGRGKTTLTDVAVSSLMCSTPDWFISNMPEDMFGGGFIARNILVVQNESPRDEDIPGPEIPTERERLMYDISQVFQIQGQASFDPTARAYHKDWYHNHKLATRHPEHEILATYYQRKPDHAKRIAICLHIAEHSSLTICLDCFTRSVKILDWVEGFIPGLLRQMFKSSSGRGAEVVLAAIRAAGGVVDYADLLRRLQHRFDGQEVRRILGSLKDSGVIDEHTDKLQHVWYIKRREEK